MARILIVDDQKNARFTLKVILQRVGHHVIEAETAEQALPQVAGGDIDVLITDLRLRGSDGLWLLREVRERAPNFPIIMLTAFGSIDNAVQAMRAGASDYVAKPFEPAQIEIAVNRALEHYTVKRELAELRRVVRQRVGTERIIGTSAAIGNVLQIVRQVARTDTPVLISGESGTGKELLARAIHEISNRAAAPFVAINCGALPESLQESELFGYARGAFTGALQTKLGLIEEADGGVLFLDEIGEMHPAAQVKLLRVLQDGEFRRLGETTVRHAHARLIAATNIDLREAVKARRFRADLFYRIHVIPIAVPALRARREDVPLLANHFLEQYGARYGRPNLQLTRAAIERLTTYAWPGNVRELESAVTRAVTLSSGTIIDASDLSLASSEEPPASLLCDSERSIIQQTLELHRWHKDEAARALGISRTTLWRKVRSYGLTPARHAADSSH